LEALLPQHEFEERFAGRNPEESERYLERYLDTGWSFFPLGMEGKVLPLERYTKRREDILRKVFLGVVCIGILYAAGSFGKDYWDNLSFSAASKKKQAEIERRRKDLAAHPEKNFKQEWQEKSRAGKVLSACALGILETPVVWEGWLLDEAECSHARQGVKISKKYTPTVVSNLRSSRGPTPDSKEPAASARDERHPAWNLGLANRDVFWKALPAARTVRLSFLQTARTLGLKTTLKIAKPEKKTIPEVGSFTCPWAVGTWTLENVPPSVLLGGIGTVLDAIQGLTLESLAYGKDSYWKLTGKVYVR
jgi:hypothetical protein